MKKPLSIGLRYFAIWTIGSAILVFVIPFIKYASVNGTISSAKQLLSDGSYDQAILLLTPRKEVWASIYPTTAHEFNCILIRCYAGLMDYRTAEKRALHIAKRRYVKPLRSSTFWDFIQKAPNGIILSINKEEQRGRYFDEYSGYRLLITTLGNQYNWDYLEELSARLIETYPSNTLGTLAGLRAALGRNNSPKAATYAARVLVMDPEAMRMHFIIAKNHAKKERWHQALNECNMELSNNPDDGFTLDLMKEAKRNIVANNARADRTQ